MAEELVHRGDDISAGSHERVAALVRAIRRAHHSPSGYGGVERFTVTDIHEFARRLVEQGVRAKNAGAT
jgi:hypothetical protein